MMAPSQGIYVALHYGCALASILFIAVSYLIHIGRAKRRKRIYSKRRSRLMRACLALLLCFYVVEGIVSLATTEYASLRSNARLVHVAVLGLVWAVIGFGPSSASLSLIWALSLVTMIFEMPLLALFHSSSLGRPSETLQFICQATRILLLIALFAGAVDTWLKERQGAAEEEAGSLLHQDDERQTTGLQGYGTESLIDHPDLADNIRGANLDDESVSDTDAYSDSGSDSDSEGGARIKRLRAKRLEETGSWWIYLEDFSIFLPHLIPRKDFKVQTCYIVCLLCLAGDRALNVLGPLQLGAVADELLLGRMPYTSLAIWLLLTLLNDDAGLGFIKELAKIPIKQFSYRQLSNAAFGHVMELGMDFHSERDSAEVMKAVEQGEALTRVLETAVLEIVPTILDLCIAILLLYSKFNAYVALALVIAGTAFMLLEIKTSNWNMGNRRRLTKAERKEARVMHQAVEGWQTVAYFNMFSFERRRFGTTVEKHLQADQKFSKRLAQIDAMLDLLVPTTFFGLSCLVFLEISHGRSSPGAFVFLIQYWDKLIWPLKYLSREYRWLMSDLVDAERLLDLLQTKPSIIDKETATDLGPVKGYVAFENVDFSYDKRKPVIEDVSFSASPGQTIALVGATGAGKSSITKLLLRFYDITAGAIRIDGHDIRDVTLSSLRNVLGVVPQDPLLFNASIRENLRYAKPDATHGELITACRAAAIHDKILSFPDGYDTTVGEHGVKLSGGEVQRLAIARVFLKNPAILILDEATSAVDTATEAEIQTVLAGLQETRTTIVVAHRLSTVVGADRILVMHDGRIVESGTHRELLQAGGRYKGLWMKQVEGVVEKEPPTIEELAAVEQP